MRSGRERVKSIVLAPASTCQQQAITESCTCGKNDVRGSSAHHCTPVVTKYSTTIRCKCVKSGRGCSQDCRCKNCGNEFGLRPNIVDPPKCKRPRHVMQRTIPKSVVFSLQQEEDITSGTRSILEFFVLEGIIAHCKDENIEQNPENVQTIFNSVTEIATSFKELLPTGDKSQEQVKKFLEEHSHNIATT